MSVRRPLQALLWTAAILAVGGPAAAQDPPPPPSTPTPSTPVPSTPVPAAPTPPAALNPCRDPTLALRCPDLVMAPPGDLAVRRVADGVRLLARNRIVNIGRGPLEVRGIQDGRPRFARAYQVVRRADGRAPVFFPEAGWIYFKDVPGRGNYWKFYRAARFELWTLNPDGTRAAMRRTGPKLSYCFRDLERVRTWARTPGRRVYPACSETRGRDRLLLGVSPGWADIYPAAYPENWISVAGLRGCFAFVHRADPLGELVESREDNNMAQRLIRLPPRNGSVAPRGCPAKG